MQPQIKQSLALTLSSNCNQLQEWPNKSFVQTDWCFEKGSDGIRGGRGSVLAIIKTKSSYPYTIIKDLSLISSFCNNHGLLHSHVNNIQHQRLSNELQHLYEVKAILHGSVFLIDGEVMFLGLEDRNKILSSGHCVMFTG